MIPDVKFKNYYLQFIYSAKTDIVKYKNELEEIVINKEELYNYLDNNKQLLIESYNINLDDYKTEWINKEYNTSELLYNKVIKLFSVANEDDNKFIIVQLIKYCNTLRQEYKYNKFIELANKRSTILSSKYRVIINAYYSKVHKCILEGKGYKFGYGIGTYYIKYKKFSNRHRSTVTVLDYSATAARKKELLAQGIKLYDENEAAWYKFRNIPYDGVDYRVFKNKEGEYLIRFKDSKMIKDKFLQYEHTEYLANKYRGMSYKQIADTVCNTIEDIYNLQLDIRYKLNILLYKYPEKCLNFMRYD